MRWAVLVGGTGSNLKALLAFGLRVDLVVSHRPGVGALDIAAEHGVPARVILPKDYADRLAYDQAVCACLEEFGIEAVAMAGFLRWLSPAVTARYRGAILNLHPSLLPSYTGLHAIERAFTDRVLWSGVTVHFVDEGHDTGPIVAQVPVPRLLEDTPADFERRIHQAEHHLYPRAIQAVDQGWVRFIDGMVSHQGGNREWMHGR